MTFESINARIAEFKEVLELNLERAGHEVDGNCIDGIWIGIEFIPQKNKSIGYHRTSYTGKWSLVIGDYGDKKRFPQRKNGSFSWDKVIKEIQNRIKLEKARIKMREETKENIDLVNEIKQQYGLSEWNTALNAGDHGSFHFNVWCDDLSKLTVLLSLAIQMGIIKKNP